MDAERQPDAGKVLAEFRLSRGQRLLTVLAALALYAIVSLVAMVLAEGYDFLHSTGAECCLVPTTHVGFTVGMLLLVGFVLVTAVLGKWAARDPEQPPAADMSK
ncbi:MAG TPA: hypothetical protein VG889_18630 [Rhizomicrobium sp.]|nr:hypothetical protein [Rhizomicrobium sp.]